MSNQRGRQKAPHAMTHSLNALREESRQKAEDMRQRELELEKGMALSAGFRQFVAKLWQTTTLK